MKRTLAILLVLGFAALGGGVMQYLHQLQHDREDTAASDGSSHPRPSHDENNCVFHAQLHSPLTSGLAATTLLLLEVLLAFVVLPGRLCLPRFSSPAIDCRGPPAC